jgi:hypothetical protein
MRTLHHVQYRPKSQPLETLAEVQMDLTIGHLRHRKTFGSITLESYLLIVLYLPILPGCAAEGDFQSGPSVADPTMQVNATTDVSSATLQGDSQSGSPNTGPPIPINATEASTSPPEEDFQSQPSQAEPMMLINSADASPSTPQEDSGLPNAGPPIPVNAAEASTSTPEEDFQSQPSQAEPVMLINSADASTPQEDSGLPNGDPSLPINAADTSGMTAEGGHGPGSLALVLGPFNSSGDDMTPKGGFQTEVPEEPRLAP